jgi:hypothetical protein
VLDPSAADDYHRKAGVELAGGAVGIADLAEDVEASGVWQEEIEYEQVGLLVVTEAEGVRRAGSRERQITIRLEVVAEKLEGRLVVLAYHHRRQRSALGKHAPLRAGGSGLSPTPADPSVERGPRRRSARAFPIGVGSRGGACRIGLLRRGRGRRPWRASAASPASTPPASRRGAATGRSAVRSGMDRGIAVTGACG